MPPRLPAIHSNLHMDAQVADCDIEARRLMDLADQEEVAQNYIGWHHAHVHMNLARNGFWEDPVKAHEADLFWADEPIPSGLPWEENPEIE